MVNKRIIGTIATVALGLSLVGAANANTLDNLMPKTTDSPQVRMTQQEMNKNMQSISDFSTVKEEEKVTDEKNIRMNPNMPNQSEMWEAMDEVQQGNYESMLEVYENMSEVHENMPHNQMHAGFENNATVNGANNQMGPQMHNSGMNRQMMGR